MKDGRSEEEEEEEERVGGNGSHERNLSDKIGFLK